MSILDTFYILFKSDTSDLEKGQKRVDKNNKDLNDGFKRTQETVQGLQVSFIDLATDAAAAVASVFSVGKAISETFKVEQQTLSLGRMADAIGMNVTKMDMFDRELKNVAGSGASIEGVFSNLTKELNRSVAVAGGFMVSLPINAFTTGLQANGVDTFVKDAAELLMKEAQKVDALRAQGATEAQIFAFSQDQLKNDPQTTMMIMRGYKGLMADFERIKEAGGLIRPEDVIAAKRFAFEFGIIRQQIDGIIRHNVTPLLQWIMNLDPGKVRDFGIALGTVGAAVAILTIDFAALAAVAIPVLLLAEAVTVLYLAIQKWDLIESKWTWVKNVSQWVNMLTDDLGRLVAVMTVFIDDLARGKSLVEALADSRNVFSEQYDHPASGYEAIKNQIRDQHGGNLALAKQQIGIADTSPLSAQTGSHQFMQNFLRQERNTKNNVTIGEIKVNAPNATDAAGIAQEIGNRLRENFGGILLQFDDGTHA